jgi:hypothetical protein
MYPNAVLAQLVDRTHDLLQPRARMFLNSYGLLSLTVQSGHCYNSDFQERRGPPTMRFT